jgi:carbonic anhydrase
MMGRKSSTGEDIRALLTENTREQVQKARSHPWISPDAPVRGFVFDLETGLLKEVFIDGAK